MKGDFSKWQFDPKNNFTGVLHQQGRVLLDSDWNAQTRITNNWQDTAGKDIIGPGVAAVPADEPTNLKVQIAAVNDDRVELFVAPGRIWADGVLVCLRGGGADLTEDVHRIATYLQPPVQDPSFDESTIGEDVLDAVILEVWREAVNGFQMPETLIEPAIGGPDTTERVHTTMAFRLFRLEPGDTCDTIRDRLKVDFSQKGRLTVSLQPTTVTDGDCPVVEGGGYTGFEHNLYRIEIAEVNPESPVMFKWSQFNGGLVGRGIFDAATRRLSITANMQAIITSGLSEFYLEAVEFDDDRGIWNVTYGAEVTLNSDNEIDLPDTATFGAIPSGGVPVFFRLWNGIREIQDTIELPDGILLEFEPPSGANYVPGDYWTFTVRAGGIGNPETLINNQPSEGIHYHRVPLAILDWNGSRRISAPEEIDDCRRIFHPVTKISTCCTYRVGDGLQSHGDFDSIQEAVDNLPAAGGEICVLPGEYTENILIDNRANITIRGCGERSRIVSQSPGDDVDTAAPVIHIRDSEGITIDSLAVDAHNTGSGIFIEGSSAPPVVVGGETVGGPTVREITLCDVRISAATRSAIEVHFGMSVTIKKCRIEMSDVASPLAGNLFCG